MRKLALLIGALAPTLVGCELDPVGPFRKTSPCIGSGDQCLSGPSIPLPDPGTGTLKGTITVNGGAPGGVAPAYVTRVRWTIAFSREVPDSGVYEFDYQLFSESECPSWLVEALVQDASGFTTFATDSIWLEGCGDHEGVDFDLVIAP